MRIAASFAEEGGNIKDVRQEILVTANDLITEVGYDQVTMVMIAKRSGITVEKLAGYYLGMQQILNDLVRHHLHVHEGIRAFTRTDPNLSPLIQDRVNLHRYQDVELLEKACDLKELPPVNATSLEAVLHGTLWGLLAEYAMEQSQTDFESIPKMVSSRVLKPLISLCQ